MKTNPEKTERQSRKGFAGMDPERQKTIASPRERTAHAKGGAHQGTSDEARQAGRKGGSARNGSEGRNLRSDSPTDAPSGSYIGL